MKILPKPVFAALLMTLSASLLALLWPEPLVLVARAEPVPAANPAPVREPLLRNNKLALQTPAPVVQKPAVAPAPVVPEPVVFAEPVTPAPPPRAALPYHYIGRLQDAQRSLAFVATGNDNFSAGIGDVLDETWRLDRIDANRLLFTHLPSHTTATLEIAGP